MPGDVASSAARVTVLVERMTDAECAIYDPFGSGDPYWHRLWHPDLPECSVVEGPTYIVAPDLPRLAQVRLSFDDAVPLPQIGACEIRTITDDDIPDAEGLRAYVRLELAFAELPADLDEHLARLPFKAYRIERGSDEPNRPSFSILDHDWSDVLPNLEWRLTGQGQPKRSLHSTASTADSNSNKTSPFAA